MNNHNVDEKIQRIKEGLEGKVGKKIRPGLPRNHKIVLGSDKGLTVPTESKDLYIVFKSGFSDLDSTAEQLIKELATRMKYISTNDNYVIEVDDNGVHPERRLHSYRL